MKLDLSTQFRQNVRAVVIAVLLLQPLSSYAQQNVLMVGYDVFSKHVVRFFSATPNVVISEVAVAGLNAGESIQGMDYRPATGELYASIVTTIAAAQRLVRLDPVTGATTPVGNGSTTFSTAAGAIGAIAFDPLSDRLRVVSEADHNLALFPDSGVVSEAGASLAYPPGDPSWPSSPTVTMLASTNHVVGAATTTFYGIDSGNGHLVTIGGLNGTPSAGGGQTNTVGLLTVTPVGKSGGFAIQPGTNAAYAAFRSTQPSTLYRISLETGKATAIGQIGGFLGIGALAIVPSNPCYDVDGDGRADALTDGLMIVRMMFGLSGAALTNGALAAGSTRNTGAAVAAHINTNCGMHLP